jgi:hypothetical protein
MDQTGQLAQPLGLQPGMDDVDRGALLTDEQHAPTAGDVIGDQVGDGLRLAGPRRALNDETLACPGPGHGGHL